MKNTGIIIKDVKVEVVDGVMGESVFTNLELQKGKKITYFTLYEAGGLGVEFYASDTSLYDYFMNEEELSDEQADFVNSKLIYSLGEVDLSCSGSWYEDIFEALTETNDEESIRIIKVLIAFTRLNWDEIKKLKENVIGKDLMKIEIPKSDVEEEYLEEKDDEEEEETEDSED